MSDVYQVQMIRDFRKGFSKEQLVNKLIVLEKSQGKRILKRDARARVEAVILEDYLNNNEVQHYSY